MSMSPARKKNSKTSLKPNLLQSQLTLSSSQGPPIGPLVDTAGAAAAAPLSMPPVDANAALTPVTPGNAAALLDPNSLLPIAFTPTADALLGRPSADPAAAAPPAPGVVTGASELPPAGVGLSPAPLGPVAASVDVAVTAALVVAALDEEVEATACA